MNTAPAPARLAMDSASTCRHVFFDLVDVERLDFAEQVVEQATKHPLNPVLDVGGMYEWDSGQASPWAMRGIAYDDLDGLFKCWYNGTDTRSSPRWWSAGYATSTDGVRWVKPHLGMHEYNGNGDNNIWSPDVFAVIILDDRDPDPSKRFKLFGHWSPEGCKRAVHYSADGLNWRLGYGFNINGWTGGRIWDCVNFMRDDIDPDPQRRYKLIWQSYEPATKPGPEEVRVKCIASSPGEADFTSSPLNPILRPNDSTEQENHFSMLFTYEGLYVLLYEYGWYTPNGRGKFGSYHGDLRLAVSRDGERWQRINPSQPVVPRGEKGAWDDGFIVASNAPVIRNGKMYLYYCGQGIEWTDWPPQNRVTPEGAMENFGPGKNRMSRMGLATVPLDGLASIRCSDRQSSGSVTTRPIRLSRRDVELRVNLANARPYRDFLCVEVLDAQTDRVLDAYSADDCEPLAEDGLSIPVRWRGAGIAATSPGEVRLRFRLYGGVKLHGYHFTPLG